MTSKALAAASTRPLVLTLLLGGEDYGYRIIQRVKELSGGELSWADNMLYPFLKRLEDEGLIVSRWRMSEEGRLRKYYGLTPAGRSALDAERKQWARVNKVLVALWKPLPIPD